MPKIYDCTLIFMLILEYSHKIIRNTKNWYGVCHCWKYIFSLNIWQLASIFTWHSRYVANCILWTLLFTYTLVAIVLIDVKYKLLHVIVIQYQISLIICQYWRKPSYLVVHTYFFFIWCKNSQHIFAVYNFLSNLLIWRFPRDYLIKKN